MMTPSKFDDGAASTSAQRETFLPVARRASASNASVVNTICSGVTLVPLQALQRVMQCFGYTHSVRMQSGRTVVVGSEIAQGGYSYVYNARDTLTGEAFALKKILCQTEDQIEMAKQEIEIHKSFAHPHIMPLSDYAVLSNEANALEYYLLFPFMENGTLREMIDISLNRRMRIPEQQILEIFLKVCRAVAELHSHSPPLAHRDIKPENILLSDTNEPILTDFGSVTAADNTITKRADALLLQECAAQLSSMPYRAPELYDVPDNAQISSRTDVWSLGCLLFAIAFGYSPFECSFYDSGEVRVVECTYLAVIGTVKFPKTHAYSPQFCDLICWLLTQDYKARPTVFDVIERLHALNP
uniref:Protein kinase domain-containing protein n=1 Tax=Globisporangium ultimum (strain ATCC 200006 / CBS 805.95 / DAOM BR144) TaxID=431595 RepID=K3XCD8_GLOUD